MVMAMVLPLNHNIESVVCVSVCMYVQICSVVVKVSI